MSSAFKCDCCGRFASGKRRALIQFRVSGYDSDPSGTSLHDCEMCRECYDCRMLYFRLRFRDWVSPRFQRRKRQ